MARVNSQFVKVAAVFAVTAVLHPVHAGTTSDAAVIEFPAETQALVSATTAFFDAIETDRGVDDRVPTIQAPKLAQKISALPPVAGAEELTKHGPLNHLTGYRISWYPLDRFLGSVDFMGTWNGNRNLVCGYLTWDLSELDQPVLKTVSANFLNLDDFAGKSPSEIHEALLEANCAFGAINDNYAFFEPAG